MKSLKTLKTEDKLLLVAYFTITFAYGVLFYIKFKNKH